MDVEHLPMVFNCAGEQLVGVVELPSAAASTGLLIVTGGPQYRVGSHRQFVDISRNLAASGIPVMRFDNRAMGDSGGESIRFDQISKDIRAALDTFVATARVDNVVLWGLCDAASACMIYGFNDPRVASLVLVNPWVRTEQGLAKAYVRHYYARRIFFLSFWKRLLSGRVFVGDSTRDFLANIRKSLSASRHSEQALDAGAVGGTSDFVERMRTGLAGFEGPVLFLLCGNDLTASEFKDFTQQSDRWRALMKRSSTTIVEIDGADHTFSTSAWRNDVIRITREWIHEEVSPRQPASRMDESCSF